MNLRINTAYISYRKKKIQKKEKPTKKKKGITLNYIVLFLLLYTKITIIKNVEIKH